MDPRLERIFKKPAFDHYVSTREELLDLIQGAPNFDEVAFRNGPLGEKTLKLFLDGFFDEDYWLVVQGDGRIGTARRSIASGLITAEGSEAHAIEKRYKDGRPPLKLDSVIVVRETIKKAERPLNAIIRGYREEGGMRITPDMIKMGLEGSPPKPPQPGLEPPLSSIFPGILSFRFFVYCHVVVPKRPWPSLKLFHDQGDATLVGWRRKWERETGTADILPVEHHFAIAPNPTRPKR